MNTLPFRNTAFLERHCVHRQKGVSEASVIKKLFQSKTGKIQHVCLAQQIRLFVKHRMLNINLTPTHVIEGYTCFGRPNVVCSHSSFEK